MITDKTNNSNNSKPQILSPAGRAGEGLLDSGEGLLGSGEGLLGSGEGLLSSGEGLLGSGEGLSSGYTTSLDNEMSAVSASMSSAFCNMQECYVSKSGPMRLLTATRYGKRYMLKCLKTDYAFTPIYRQALQKEFEIGLQLEHPNICRTFGMEQVEGLGSTIVMEHVDGDTLESLIGRKMLSAELAMKIVRQLLDALEYMHGKGIIHRDLKPANIMVTHHGKDVKVIDFSLSDSDTFCVLKSPAGTMGYIAPEQLEPGAKADVRVDIFSLGKVMQDMADATGNRSLARLAAECACADVGARPSTVAQVRALLSVERMPWRILSWGLSAAAVALLVFIGFTLYGRNAAGRGKTAVTTVGQEASAPDSALVGGGNRVLDRSCWP